MSLYLRVYMLRHSLVVLSILILVFTVPVAQAQFEGAPPDTLRLNDLSAFQDEAENWSIVDSAWADPDRSHHLGATPGTGVLVNQPSEAAHGHLRTRWTHRDLEIEMDVMMPRGSNSGIYLQGRYEVQLLDSWGVQNPTYADMGGIYQRWDAGRPKGKRGLGGHPPRVNVAKAPGLWQHLKIDFRAPRFDEEGKKIEYARFEKVVLNGVVIHRNVVLRGPTRAAAFSDEAPTGPLLIQGDHGPVAVKNVRYKRYEPGTIQLTDLTYDRYDAVLNEGLHQLDTVEVAERGSAHRLRPEVIGRDNEFAAVFDGTLAVPRSGPYTFELVLDWITGVPHSSDQPVGGGRLRVNDETVVAHAGSTRTASGTVQLEEGRHSFRLSYFKNRDRGRPLVDLFVEGPRLRRREFTVEDVSETTPSDPILVEPEGEPSLLRSFFRHGSEKRTHVISVGDPRGVHYAYDLAQGSVLRVWKGLFLRANQMWEGRGREQRAVPRGTGPVFTAAPPLAVLPTPTSPWPDSVRPKAEQEYLGYRLGEQGQPTFRYRFEGLAVEDQIRADSTGGRLVRTIRLTGRPTSEDIFVRLLRADTLRRVASARFVGGDRQFYVDASGTTADLRVRRNRGARELLAPVLAQELPTEFRYAIVW